MTRITRLAGLLLCLAVAPVVAQGANKSLTIAAAANLKYALDEVVNAYEVQAPGIDARVTYGASGTFFGQIQNGAPFDLFLSADETFPQKLVDAGLASGNVVTYALGKLVVWVPRTSKVDCERNGLEALLDPAVQKIAIANPAVAPYGVAAESALKAAGIYEAVKGKLVLGENVSQAAQFVQSGNAQAALLPLSIASAPPLGIEGRYWTAPAGTYPRIGQAAVVLRSSKEPALSRAFLAFLLGPRGRAILEKCGYGLPPAR